MTDNRTWHEAAGFTRVAELLTQHYGELVTRQRVYEWWQRGTRNKAGQRFPHGTEIPAPAHRPNLHFDMSDVLAWTAAGVPERYGAGWRHLGPATMTVAEIRELAAQILRQAS
jgi:hypothetical protein